MIEWLEDKFGSNWYEWVFSGIGVFIISILISFVAYFFFKKEKSSQSIKSGDNSINTQISGSNNTYSPYNQEPKARKK